MASRMVMPSASFCSSQARIEVADQRAGAQEGGLVALAFLFGEGDHLDAERQPPAWRASSRTQAIGTKMPSRPSYLPPLRTVS
jgi:hypothetical protein